MFENIVDQMQNGPSSRTGRRLVSGAAQIGSSILDPYKEFDTVSASPSAKVDYSEIQGQDFKWDPGKVVGGVLGGLGSLAKGNLIGAAAGLGSAAISGVRQIVANNKFKRDQQVAMRNAMRHNYGIDYNRERSNLASMAFGDAYRNFYQ